MSYSYLGLICACKYEDVIGIMNVLELVMYKDLCMWLMLKH
jgi:hypothetical protein